MSIKLLSAAWDLQIGSTEKMVLMCLCDFANEHGICWPSVATICRKTSKSERTVQTALKWLKDSGFYEVNGYHKQTPLYELNASKILAAQPLEYSHYVYRIDDHNTGYFYIGARSCSCAIEDDDYMGSGNWVKAARRDGHALSKSIIQVLGSREELAHAEVAHVTPVFGSADCKNEKIPTPGTLSTPADIAPRNFRTPQKLQNTPAKSAPKPLRTTIVDKANALPTKRASAPAMPEGVDLNVWNDFLELRKAKRAPLSNTALAAIEREAALAGWSLNDALAECAARGWQSFKADWVKEARNGTATSTSRPDRRSSLARAIDEGLGHLG